MILEDGTKLSDEGLTTQLEKDLINHNFGFCDSNLPEHVCLSLTAEVANYSTTIKWLQRLLYRGQFNASKMLSRVADIKQSMAGTLRDGWSVLHELCIRKIYDERLVRHTYCTSEIIKWIPEFERELEEKPKEVVKNLEKLRDLRESSSHY